MNMNGWTDDDKDESKPRIWTFFVVPLLSVSANQCLDYKTSRRISHEMHQPEIVMVHSQGNNISAYSMNCNCAIFEGFKLLGSTTVNA
jgi:hypothetical protein